MVTWNHHFRDKPPMPKDIMGVSFLKLITLDITAPGKRSFTNRLNELMGNPEVMTNAELFSLLMIREEIHPYCSKWDRMIKTLANAFQVREFDLEMYIRKNRTPLYKLTENIPEYYREDLMVWMNLNTLLNVSTLSDLKHWEESYTDKWKWLEEAYKEVSNMLDDWVVEDEGILAMYEKSLLRLRICTGITQREIEEFLNHHC